MSELNTAAAVHIIGTGLLGASIGLGLRADGLDVTLEDLSPTAQSLAADYGAGRPRSADDPDPVLVIVATPPDVTANTVMRALDAFPGAVVTDVASVKRQPLDQLRSSGADLGRYLGSHPMAGRERGGAIMARADLFIARPWVICRREDTSEASFELVHEVAERLGGTPIEMDPVRHDEAVGLVSHVPQLVSTLLSTQLITAEDSQVSLAGQGLRDVSRLGASDPELWVQILGANAAPVLRVLEGFREDLEAVMRALQDPEASGARRSLADALAAGNLGVARIPGKHGASERFATITVIIDDRPGQLAKLLTEIGELGINMEDLRMEHSPGAQIGFAEIAVLPEVLEHAVTDLGARGWSIL